MTHPLFGLFLIVLVCSSCYALGRISGRRDRLDAYRCGRQDGTDEEWNRQRTYLQTALQQAFSNRITVAFAWSAANGQRGNDRVGTTYRSKTAVARVPAPREATDWFNPPRPAQQPAAHNQPEAPQGEQTEPLAEEPLNELSETKEPAVREG